MSTYAAAIVNGSKQLEATLDNISLYANVS